MAPSDHFKLQNIAALIDPLPSAKNPFDFPRTASIGAVIESRPLSSRIPDAAGASGLLLVRAAVVAAPIRRTTHDEHAHGSCQRGTRHRLR
jgi:hypothetical protein